MRKFHSSIYFIGLLLTACESPRDLDGDDSSNASEPGRACQAHTDCQDNEVCFPKEGCAVPWGRFFFLEDLRFGGPSEEFEDTCSVAAQWYPDRSLAEGIFFKQKQWDTAASKVWYKAVPDSEASVFVRFDPVEDTDTCPNHEQQGPLCINGGCEPFGIEHYRSSEMIEFTNATGDSLRFRLVPAGKERPDHADFVE